MAKRKQRFMGLFNPKSKPIGPFARPEKHRQKIVNPIKGFVRAKKPKRLTA